MASWWVSTITTVAASSRRCLQAQSFSRASLVRKSWRARANAHAKLNLLEPLGPPLIVPTSRINSSGNPSNIAYLGHPRDLNSTLNTF